MTNVNVNDLPSSAGWHVSLFKPLRYFGPYPPTHKLSGRKNSEVEFTRLINEITSQLDVLTIEYLDKDNAGLRQIGGSLPSAL